VTLSTADIKEIAEKTFKNNDENGEK